MKSVRNPFLIGIVLLGMIIGSSTLTRGSEWGDDFASYIMQAQSILNGKTADFIERNTFTIFESSVQIGPVAYPWGYPLMLTPVLLLKGVHPLALKIPGLLCFAGFLFCLHLLTEKRLSRIGSLILVSLFAFNPTLIKFLDQILSDIPFLFFTFLALLLISNFKDDQTAWKKLSLGAIIFLAAFIRTTGIILLAGFLADRAIHFYRDNNQRKAITFGSIVVVIGFAIPWLISTSIFPNGQGSYFRQLMDLTPAIIFKTNIPGYFSLFWQFFDLPSSWIFIYYLLIILFLIGAWTRREDDQSLIVFFMLYLMGMLLWPEWQGIRFVFPLMPLFVYFAMQGLEAVVKIPPEEYHLASKVTSNIFWLLIIGYFLFTSSTLAYANLQDNRKINGPFDPYSGDMYNYITSKTDPHSVIIFFKPRAMRLFTDRNSIMVLECSRLPLGDYVVIHKTWQYSQILPNDIENCGIPLRNVFENQRFIIYKIQRQVS